MSGELQRVVTASFAAGARSAPLSIQADPGTYSDALVHLYLIPDVPAGLKATAGVAFLGNSKEIDVPGGLLRFADSDTASLPAPPAGIAPKFETLFAIASGGDPLDPTGASAHYNAAAFEVRLSRRCTAAVAYTPYKARVRTITYQPKVEASPAGGAKTTFGIVVAHYQGELADYEVSPFTVERGEATIELYRRTSPKVINADGQFEKSPGYPQSGSYPGKSFVLDVVGSREVERVHEIGFITQDGRTFVYTPAVNILEPYVGDGAYAPTITCQVATLDPQKYPKEIIARANDFVKSKGLGCTGG